MMIKRDDVTVGIDLGGTKVEIALVDREGRMLSTRRIPTLAARGADEVIADIAQGVRAALEEEGIIPAAVGVAVAGQVDPDRGHVSFAPNLGWHEVPLAATLERMLELPVVAANDVRAATVAEWIWGAGKGERDLVCAFVGTGLGGGIVAGGRILRGAENSAGEIGHVTLIQGGRKCRCPNEGCLEAYVGGWAIAERAQEAAALDPAGAKKLVEAAGGIPAAITAVHVVEQAHGGSGFCSGLVTEMLRHLGAGLVGVVNAFNPSVLILGGGVIDGMPDAISEVERALKRFGLPAATRNLRVMRSALGKHAGVIGAAALASVREDTERMARSA